MISHSSPDEHVHDDASAASPSWKGEMEQIQSKRGNISWEGRK